jgi:NAD(P)-dependent dehydrogenase (short-subunit alcohol dehydrogenase family)
VDVRDAAAMADAVAASAALGPVHGLVHVAGGMRPDQWAPLLAEDDPAFDTVMELNFRSAVTTSKAVGAHLARTGAGGSIVFIASIVAMSAMPYGAAYAAAKAAVLATMRTAAIEWGPVGIRVNAVAPGTIRTPKNDADQRVDEAGNRTTESIVVPLGRRGTPDDIAAAVLFLQSDLASYVTGQVIAVDGGSSIRPGYLDADGLPVFVRDEALRARLTAPA